MSSPELIIFDCDGVLIDSEVISARVLIELLTPIGVLIDAAHVSENFLGRSFPSVAADIRRDFSVLLPAGFEQSYRRVLLQTFESELQATPNLISLLPSLAMKTCIATSSSPERATRSLEIVGLRAEFDGRIYTASEVNNGKPAPDLFLHAASHESVKPEKCIVVEDSTPGVEAARAAGMRVCRYLGGAHFNAEQRRGLTAESEVPTFDCWTQFPALLNRM